MSDENIRILPMAAIQVDCDGEMALSNHYGRSPGRGKDQVYPSLLKFLDIFSRHGIKATLFISAKDIEDKFKLEVIRVAAAQGHELANHTYNHPGAFLRLSREEKLREIHFNQEKVRKMLGINMYGFRAPNFELDEELINILFEAGLTYDCSMLPTPFSPLLRGIKTVLSGFSGSFSMNNGYLGRLSFSLAPRYPYHPCGKAVWKKQINGIQAGKVIEAPVSVSPWFRFPCHSSYALIYPSFLAKLLTKRFIVWNAKKKLPLIYVFHLSDICKTEKLGRVEALLYRSCEKRINFVDWVCNEIKSNFNCVRTLELVNYCFENTEER